jgi:peptidoglycan hydrolase-like protein with peptidoglycan-binding domain
MLLRKGDKGELVQALQEALLALGYHPGPIDGHFGGLTEEALEKFQKSAKISVDGICGRTTFGELNEALVSQGAEALDLPEENNTDPEPAGKMLS